jgi:hypothetical protein
MKKCLDARDLVWLSEQIFFFAEFNQKGEQCTRRKLQDL